MTNLTCRASRTAGRGDGGVGKDDFGILGEGGRWEFKFSDAARGKDGGEFAIDGETVGGIEIRRGIGRAFDEENGDFFADIQNQAAGVVNGEEIRRKLCFEGVATGSGDGELQERGLGGARFDFPEFFGVDLDAVEINNKREIDLRMIGGVEESRLEFCVGVGHDDGTLRSEIGDRHVGLIGLPEVDEAEGDIIRGECGEFLLELFPSRLAIDGTAREVGEENDRAVRSGGIEGFESFRGLIECGGEVGGSIGELSGADFSFEGGVIKSGLVAGFLTIAAGADQHDFVARGRGCEEIGEKFFRLIEGGGLSGFLIAHGVGIIPKKNRGGLPRKSVAEDVGADDQPGHAGGEDKEH